MSETILEMATAQGIWAACFVGLFIYVLKENSLREQKYQNIISELTSKFEKLEIAIEHIYEFLKSNKQINS